MPREFPLASLPDVAGVPDLLDENPPVASVTNAFDALSGYGDPIGVKDGGVFPPYSYLQWPEIGLNESHNHFQGMQRLRRGKYLAVSGAFSTGRNRGSHIFIVRMGSRPQSGGWGSNLVHRLTPGDDDAVIAVYGLSKTYWHPGGLSLAGDILAVPLEGGKGTRIEFLHARDPERLERLGVEIYRPGIKKAGAVGLTRLADRRYLCATWRDNPDRAVHFHFSRTANFFEGFDAEPAGTWRFQRLRAGDSRKPKYQNINFVTEASAAGLRYFLIGTENRESSLTPVVNSPNYADLWEVHPAAISPSDSSGALTHVDTREFRGLGHFGNFQAAAGVHLADTGALSLYAGYHWRIGDTLRFTEFTGRPQGPVSRLHEGWIELYEVEHFRGKRLGLNGTADGDLADYSAIYVEGGDFDEEVSSVRYQLPVGAVYRLYSEPRFTGNSLDLVGDGQLRTIPDLGAAGFGNRVLSSRYEQRPAG